MGFALVFTSWFLPDQSVRCQHKELGEKSYTVSAFRVGKILKWAVPFCFLPPSPQPDALDPAAERRREVTAVHSHRAQGARASLPVCTEAVVPLTKEESKRQKGRENRCWLERPDSFLVNYLEMNNKCYQARCVHLADMKFP